MTYLRSLLGSLSSIGSAARVAAALESGWAPLADDLRRLGIDPRDFASIGHG